MDKHELKIRVDLPEAVNNVLEEPAKTLGTKISDLIEIIFGGISYKKMEVSLKRQQNFESFKAKIQEEIDKIPVDERIEPSESIVGPALEASKYRIEYEDIRNMFAKLLASSVDKTKSTKIHPCFIEILKNLSSEDALAIRKISEMRNSFLSPVIGVPNDVLLIPNNGRYYSWLAADFGFEKSNVILTSLLRNGLIEINNINQSELTFLKFSFDKMEASFRNEVACAKNQIELHKGFISLTPLGNDFVVICSPDTVDMDIVNTLKEFSKTNGLSFTEIKSILSQENLSNETN